MFMKLRVWSPARIDPPPAREHGWWAHTRKKYFGRRLPLVALVVSLAAVLLSLVSSGPASADGDAVEIFRGRQVAYEVVVGVLPETPKVGIIHFFITPLEEATLAPVDDAEIIIVADDPSGRPAYQARALDLPDSPVLYEASIKFESAGSWLLRIIVRTDALGEATFTVPLEIAEQPITPGTAGGFVFLGVFVVLIGGAIYIWYSVRRRRVGART